MATLNWCAYDSDFTPKKLDTRFKDWTAKGITAVCNVMKERTLLSFVTLKEKHSLEKHDFYRYLQMRHYICLKMKNMTDRHVFDRVVQEGI